MAFRINMWPVNLAVTLTKFDLLERMMPGRVQLRIKTLTEQILIDSMTVPPMVPVDTGDLESTGRVEKSSGGWAVVYGGVSKGKFVDYANQVHDDLRPRKYRKAGSGPKFVEAHYLRRTGGEDVEMNKVLSMLVKEVGL